MTEIMSTSIIILRKFVVALRASCHDVTLEQRVGERQARLSYLVPLYRAMHAAVQQAGTGAAGGVKAYTAQFEKLGRLIRSDVDYRREKYFGGAVGGLPLLVPVAGVPVENWPAVTIDEIIAQSQQQLADERHAARQRAMAAEQARKAFLASLNNEQRALLRQALDVSRAKGCHALSVDHRDLEA